MKKSDKEEILDAINNFSSHIDNRITKMETGFDDKLAKMETGFDDKLAKMGTGFDDKLAKMETRLVTKDYLDEKMSDLRGDLVVMLRKEDNKFQMLVEIMKGKKLLDDNDVEKILSMEPFAKTYL